MLFITLGNVLIGSSHGPTNPLTDRAKRANRLTRAPTRDGAHVRTIKRSTLCDPDPHDSTIFQFAQSFSSFA
jgi:hypothetical protein